MARAARKIPEPSSRKLLRLLKLLFPENVIDGVLTLEFSIDMIIIVLVNLNPVN